ncbi:MAG: hypothetical protein H6730_37510 [Deltaproteobacteria bacterium]|nr:hypothetical protein [Deltaproteobacteria bacterium]
MNTQPNARPARRPAPGTRPRVRVAQPSQPRVPAARATPPSQPCVQAARPAESARPAERSAEAQVMALTCLPTQCDFDRVDSTAMFNTLGGIRALAAADAGQALARRSLAELRGYRREDLMAIAEVGYHYLRSGGHKLASVIFEGLTAVMPEEPYFWLALGLVKDHLDDISAARVAYETAARLDPRDATPLMNLAELDLMQGRRRDALRRLDGAANTAQRAQQWALVRKAEGLRTLMGVA